MKRSALSLIALLFFAIPGCSSSGSGIGVIPQNSSRLTPERKTYHASASLTIRIPKGIHRRANYVSPATASAKVVIAPKAGCNTCSPKRSLNVALSASSSHCKSSSTGITCSIAIALSEGSYTGSLTTFDASGSTLSENQSFPISITGGKANTIGVTLNGVPAGVNVALADPNRGSQSFDVSGQETIDIAGGNQAQVVITPVDADDYVIAGPG